ncbi:hypothetical protein ACNKHM_28730 [Shigella sonnei]
MRLVCATNADLPAMVNEGTFRATCSTAGFRCSATATTARA